MTAVSTRSRVLNDRNIVHVSDTGAFFASSKDFVDRMVRGSPTRHEAAYLKEHGFTYDSSDPFDQTARLSNLAQRWSQAGQLDYLILVPTLRCNLSCSYCQVSRANENASGHDWSDETLSKVLAFIDELPPDRIKIEFQGGEPTLRPDLVRAVIAHCQRFEDRQFVICTNLQSLDDDTWSILEDPDVFVSTSLDGTIDTHKAQRTGDRTQDFLQNLTEVIERFGSRKVSALPTIDPRKPPEIDTVIDTFSVFGLDSIFLRPINFQGFARKRHSHSKDPDANWNAYHRAFVERIIDLNWNDRSRVLEETYFSICLRRIFQPRADRHVDLRNPNPLAVDYLVVDFDGTLYPTDEARMLARSGIIDLSLGKVGDDWKKERWQVLNQHCSNVLDPACERCAYQPFCGRDLVDDLARYGKIDVVRTETAFCRRHLDLFDFAFELIYRDDERVNYSLSRWLRMDGTPAALGERIS